MAAEGADTDLSADLFDAESRVWVESLLARCTFPNGTSPLRCAVSGGADSVAMLVLAMLAGHSVVVVHVDHGIQETSSADALLVGALAERLGVPFELHTVSVTDGPNLEARARKARYLALGPDSVVAHTADDRAEWVLIALMRGSGMDGIAAMHPARRPVLGLRRGETRDLCRLLDLETVDDPHNHDDRFVRIRVRRELLPLMGDIAGRDVAPLLDRLASIVSDEIDLLDGLAADLDPTDARALAAAPVGLARRAVRAWLRADHPLDLASTDRVLDVAAGRSLATEIVGGRRVWRSGQRLHVGGPISAASVP
ncbi:MAG: tRNA lysidine(34) synthetase TilS [Actinomycetia bacterium]|nr:tRNA lysidine(34) synthetase TilS [Actinomycetes bacterium]MCP4961875.1 tRNA lysidine(34) synthetase TilS [Actinomycetes bacterium]